MTYSNITEISMHSKIPISEDIARRILCLPQCYKLEFEDIDRITKIIGEAL